MARHSRSRAADSDLIVGSKALIKDINRSRIIAEVRMHGPISRSELSKRIGLVPSTVSKVSDQLISEGLFYESGRGESTGGRRPVYLSFDNGYGYVIAIKIEHNHLVFAVVNLKPFVLETFARDFALGTPFGDVEPMLIEGIRDAESRIPGSGKPLVGISIAVSGIVDPLSGRLTKSTLLGWENVDFSSVIGRHYSCPVYVENDVNCYALSQSLLGNGRSARSFCCVTIGEGIGAGLIVDGTLYRGAIGGAGELGHTIVKGDGEQCHCGQRGCLEAYASSSAIIEAVHRSTGEHLSVESIVERARAGDRACSAALRRAGKALGWGLVSVVSFFNPEKIIVGGEGVVEKEFILPIVQSEIDRNWFSTMGGFHTDIEVDELGNENFILGAAVLALNGLFGLPLRGDTTPLPQ
jgi:predicted NBD/HSP70 family sugar kinase